jgi:hypothetical protein
MFDTGDNVERLGADAACSRWEGWLQTISLWLGDGRGSLRPLAAGAGMGMAE